MSSGSDKEIRRDGGDHEEIGEGEHHHFLLQDEMRLYLVEFKIQQEMKEATEQSLKYYELR
ncbi:hypothetical protein AALP_AA5G263500 [Arabis alpina]|uniref:Uncharacterized protein n=1 Tax=Arabis alpina TaxID=50452 RepID=A0A087GZH0_ARAAL|nr:hypothetical protein AALP_AA5G263500 [Arabis alpina]